ncbi:MAG TPA: glycosyltransferase family 2 protein [Corynebacterium stationis]|uniref:glycosyltransferase family 2 protein n=2 Tax=Corynebacterium stationis TaxID=1705 RepID=UPI001D3166E0|nr:glycosyltransferase family A protein [Corynebacterium stationis]HJG64727.1 glycosyltransferase family 2 protein [Corynebacterium stationis]
MPARDSSQWGAPNSSKSEVVPLEVLIPCFERPAELAVTLSGLAAQMEQDFDIILSDQSGTAIWEDSSVVAMVRVLRAQGRTVRCERNLPCRGLAQQRHHLLQLSNAPLVLFLDSDVWLEPGTMSRMLSALNQYGGGFIGSAVQGLSYLQDERPAEWAPFEPWESRVAPEPVPDSGPAHERWRLHNAANLCHLAARQDFGPDGFLAYKIAWVGGCVLFDRECLLEAGGFEFWSQLPANHAGEDVLAQWKVLSRYGGAAVLPSGAVHLEAPTTVMDRSTEATEVLTAES